MDGPITCEDLRNIGPRVIQAELDKFVKLIADDIQTCIINTAFATTRSGGIHAPIAIEASSMTYGGRPTPSKYQIIYQTSRMKGNRLVNMNLIHGHIDNSYIVQSVIKRIRDIFPDMKIVVDPLETYILFDWSPNNT
jgi:ABC-type antimicrobial peptide transport system permease subunit